MDLRSTEQSSKKHNHPDTEKIFSDADFDILKTAENRVRTSVFLLSEPSLDFKNRLREKIRAARHSQSHRSLKQWSIEFFKPFFRLPQWRPVLAMVVVIALVITSVQIWPLWHSSQSTHLSRLLIDTAYAQDNFEVVPTKTDQVGLATDSAFTVTSKQAVDVGILRKNITVVPAIDFDFQKVSDHEFKIIPRQPLLDKTVYRVYINSSYVGMNGIIIDRPFSWVFQVRDQFSLTSNIPRNFATDVPVTTGIELQFSRADFEDYEHYISFSPALSGHFEKKGKIVTFIPNQALKPATIYTVTLKPGLPVQNSTDKLLKGSSIAFETAPTLSPDQPASYLNVADNFVQFTPEQTPFLEIFSTIPEHQSVRLEVFSLSTAQDFSRAYLDEEKGINSWSKYNHQVPVDQSAFPVTRVTTTLEYFNHRSYVVLPSKLAAGWYLARITGQGETSYAFIQSTYLATYGVVSSNKVLVWLHNLKNHEPLSGATLYNPENHVVMTSDRQGIATIETAQLFSATSTASTSLHSLLVQNNGEQAVMMLNRPDPSKENSGYWNYLSTDRTIYQPTDQLYFWGMIQPRSNTTSTPPTITVRLTGGNTSEAIVEKIVPLDQGFFKGTVNLEQLQPGYYELQLFSNGNTLGQSRYLTIARSVKPAYQITVTPDKPVAYMGESLTYRIAASFFDGTPVAYLPVKYGTSPSDTLKLDATGQGTITIPTAPYPCRENKQCSRSYYDSKELEVTPQ